MKTKNIIIFISVLCSMLVSCKKYLDVVPDDIATLDMAFSNRNEAEKYLYTCYSYIPSNHTAQGNVALMGADELWTFYPNGSGFTPWEIARGNQNANDPYMNCWSERNGGSAFYKAIRDCNIFLENVKDESKISDLSAGMRKRWIGEVTFLKAYYHFLLFRMYGPIVIVDKNIPVDASNDVVRVKRSPVDSVVNFISGLLDESCINLPPYITNQTEELGRITAPAALSLKARLLVTAASPLFNGNVDYANFTDKDGEHLFYTTYDEGKWVKAVEACRKAIETCEQNNIQMYQFQTYLALSDTTKIQMSIRNSVGEKWNRELIWGLSSRAVDGLQGDCMARIGTYTQNMWAARELVNPTLEIVNQCYTENGVPINEDKTWNYSGRYETKVATHDDRFNLAENYETALFHFKREPRFYANLAFDGSVWYMQNSPSGTDENTFTVKGRVGQPQAKMGAYNYSCTGYWAKKLVSWKLVLSENSSTTERFPWPEIRLSDLYLLYAEALNEIGDMENALVWLDKVRERAGLKGVKESWTKYSTKPTKYSSVSGLREIIHQERSIELMFEGHRFWDLRRWKEAEKMLNKKITGWDIDQESPAAYYRPKVLFNMTFIAPRDYLWPLRDEDLIVNPRLVQNPGW